MKQETLKTGMSICGHCGGTYNRKECIRIYGEFSAPAIYGFCSASCYTQHDVKPEPQPKDESQKELFTGGEWEFEKHHIGEYCGNVVANLGTGENGMTNIRTIDVVLKNAGESESIANGMLLAQAKNMYFALKESSELINELLSYGDHHPLLDKIESILKKANPNK